MNRPTVLALAAGVPVAVLLLAGCGGSSAPSTSDAGATPAPTASPSAGAGRGAGARGPAAFGEIAAVTGTTLQVQNTQSQTAVTWSASTAFTETVPATLAVGDCVTATGTPGSGAALTATSVRVLAPSGSCTLARGGASGAPRARPSGGFGGRRGGASGAPPSGAPGGRDFATAFGKVTAVTGSTVTVSGRLLAFDRRSPGATPSATPSASAETVTVTLGSAATVQRTAKATGADAKVGTCAVATGKADSAGTVAATAIALSAKGPGGCTGGFGGRFGGGGFGG